MVPLACIEVTVGLSSVLFCYSNRIFLGLHGYLSNNVHRSTLNTLLHHCSDIQPRHQVQLYSSHHHQLICFSQHRLRFNRFQSFLLHYGNGLLSLQCFFYLFHIFYPTRHEHSSNICYNRQLKSRCIFFGWDSCLSRPFSCRLRSYCRFLHPCRLLKYHQC